MNGDVGLLSRAADYALAAAETVTPELWARPTPCARWDLQMLLRHACESVAALHQGLLTGRVALFSAPDDHSPLDLTELFGTRLAALVDEWPDTDASRVVDIADRGIAISAMAGAAALEIAVHGWDIAQASGHPRSIPPDLATRLHAIAARLIDDANRYPLFAPPIPLAEGTGPGEELLAFLGRR